MPFDLGGRVHRDVFEFARRYVAGGITPDEMRQELLAQCEHVLATRLLVTHLDSHQHVHMLPRVLDVVLELATALGVRAVRLPHERGVHRWLGSASLARMAQALVLAGFCRLAERRVAACVDGFGGFFDGGRLDKPRLLRLLAHVARGGTWELMCHPGLDDPSSPYAHWGYDWGGELRALTDPEVGGFVRTCLIETVSVRDIRPTSGRPGGASTRLACSK